MPAPPRNGSFPMRRWLLAGAATVSMTLAGTALAGEGWNDFWCGAYTDFYRNNSWPEPFVSADRAVARLPFCLQVDNGWKMHNTVGSYLYDTNTQQLNQAGELLVKWIVTQAPLH